MLKHVKKLKLTRMGEITEHKYKEINLIVFQMSNISTLKGGRINTNNFWMQYYDYIPSNKS